jgi:hypothetical protein
LNDQPLAILDAVDERGLGVRVAFFRVAHRFAHRIALVVDTGVQWVLASVEGDNRQAFPPSPPLQQLATEVGIAGCPATLLLGMAGRNHWSVSVESHPADRRIRFDVACRARVADRERLRSAYELLGPWPLSAGDGVEAVELSGPGFCLRCEAAAEERWPTIVRVENDHLVFGPAQAGEAFTHRWRYDMVLSAGRPASS